MRVCHASSFQSLPVGGLFQSRRRSRRHGPSSGRRSVLVPQLAAWHRSFARGFPGTTISSGGAVIRGAWRLTSLFVRVTPRWSPRQMRGAVGFTARRGQARGRTTALLERGRCSAKAFFSVEEGSLACVASPRAWKGAGGETRGVGRRETHSGVSLSLSRLGFGLFGFPRAWPCDVRCFSCPWPPLACGSLMSWGVPLMLASGPSGLEPLSLAWWLKFSLLPFRRSLLGLRFVSSAARSAPTCPFFNPCQFPTSRRGGHNPPVNPDPQPTTKTNKQHKQTNKTSEN